MNEILLFILSIFFGVFLYQLQKWLNKPQQFKRMKFSLMDGHHTEVVFIKENFKIIAFPTFNVNLVLEYGTLEAKKAFEKAMRGKWD